MRSKKSYETGYGIHGCADLCCSVQAFDELGDQALVGLVKAARVRLGSFEFEKKGVSRFDMRDPYRLAVTLTWPQFLAALLALYLAVNVVFATLFWLVPGSVANARPHSFADAYFFSIETAATVGYGEMYPATAYGRVVAATEIPCGLAFTACGFYSEVYFFRS